MGTFNETNRMGFVELKFSPVWDYIPFIREYIHNVMSLYLKDGKEIEKVTVAVSEILENAVKYSVKPGVRMVLEGAKDNGLIQLCVYNYADPDHAKRLIKNVKLMNQSDPLTFYVEKMRASVGQKVGEANIGLARIYYESSGHISAEYVDEGLMKVTVVFNELRGIEEND